MRSSNIKQVRRIVLDLSREVEGLQIFTCSTIQDLLSMIDRCLNPKDYAVEPEEVEPESVLHQVRDDLNEILLRLQE